MTEARQIVALGQDSYYELTPFVLHCSPDEFASLRAFMEDVVKATPNPRNQKYALKRKQCTFVEDGACEYEFGQYNQTFRNDVEWPPMISRVLNIVRAQAVRFGVKPQWYNGVHTNLYRDGSVGVMPHSDKEKSMVDGAPIFSFTLLSDPARPRPFSIYTLGDKKMHDVRLEHGSMLVMYGQMQKHFKHGVEAAKPPKMYRDLARINLTVRAFRPEPTGA